jgi:hypothetical protein
MGLFRPARPYSLGLKGPVPAVLFCTGGSAQLTGKPAYRVRAFERVGAFAIRAVERARTLTTRWQCESQIRPTMRAGWSFGLSHDKYYDDAKNRRQLN